MNKHLSTKIKVISFILCIMVVFIHSYNNNGVDFLSKNISIAKGYSSFFQDFFSSGIAQIAVPLFFSISGYLFFLNTDGKLINFILKIRTRFRTLVLPYLFWSIGGLILYYFLQSFPISSPFFTNKLIRDYSNYEILNSIFFHQIPVQLWYLRDLFILVLLSPVIYWLVNYLKFIAILILIFTWFLDVNFRIFSNEAFLFFSIGTFLSIFKKEIVIQDFSKGCFLYVCIWITIILIKTIYIYNGFQDGLLQNTFRKISIVFGLAAIWSFYDFLFKDEKLMNKKISPILSFSFFVFAFHEPTLDIIKKGLFYFMGKNEIASLLIYIAAPLITIYIGILIGSNLKHFTPKLYNIMTGGR